MQSPKLIASNPAQRIAEAVSKKLKMKYYLNHPLKTEPIEFGEINKEDFKEIFDKYPWIEFLKKQLAANEKEIKCSPSITIENEEGIGVDFSIVGEVDNYEFYICYKRPTLRKKKKWFKTIEYIDKEWHSIIPEQNLNDGIEAFNLLFDRDFETLEKKWG